MMPTVEIPVMEPSPAALGSEPVTYASTGNALLAPLGALRLSDRFAQLESHNGYMTLEFAGVMPKFPGYRIASQFLAGASVYRVTNAEQYFADNPTICGGKPLRFVVAKVESLAEIQDGTTAVTLWLLSLEDYNEFGPSTFDPCGGDTYRAAKVD